jgi:ATP-dependent exoDNAse (exonuclease V) alpha subunit
VDLKEIIKKIDDGKHVLLTGPAGTGKSTIVKELKAHYKWKLVVTATTGVAALNIGGCTIHSFSGIGIHNDVKALRTIMEQYNWAKVQRRIRRTHTVVVDEISMFSAKQLELLDRVFREATNINKPFGGITMVFVGDFLQLPPVIKQTDSGNGWVFNSKTWIEAQIEPIHLYTIHRQEDESFLKHLIALRFGWCQPDTDEFFRSREVSEADLEPNILRFFSTNIEADNYNDKSLMSIDAPLQNHIADVWGMNENYEKQIKNSTLALEFLELKVGARVMFLNNKKDKDTEEFIWVNGSLGTIVDYVAGSPVVEVDETSERVTVDRHTWEMKDWEDNLLASFEQLPLRLAYGVTIHKSQGLTLSKAVIDCRRIFANGQAYVALSRVRTAEGLFLLNWNHKLIKADPVAVEYYLKSMG